MTDPWESQPCATCKGRGEVMFVRGEHRSSVKCWDCDGGGRTGARPEQRGYGPPLEEALRPVADHPAVRASGLCGTCLGARVVVISGTFVETPCPACTTKM